MTNNVIPDSIITNIICRSLAPPPDDELNEPRLGDSSAEVALTSKNTLRILNTIKPVTRAFTAMDTPKLATVTGSPQGAFEVWPWLLNVIAASEPNQVARVDNLKSKLAYQKKKDWLTHEYDYQEWRNDHDTDILSPHYPTTVDLLKI